MSKFLTQSKTFLPMVMQKSTTDAIQILEKYPSLSTAQHEGLPKQETQKEEEKLNQNVPKQDLPKLEPLHPEILQQITSSPKESLKIVLHANPAISTEDSGKKPEVFKSPMDKSPLDKCPLDKSPLDKCPLDKSPLEKGPESLKVVAVESGSQKTLFKALILDLVQVQRKLVVLLSQGQMWLWMRVMGDQMGPGTFTMSKVEQPQPKDRIPVPLSVGQKRVEPKIKPEEKSKNESNIKSNLLDVIQENSPAWQNSISNQLGELQKVVVQKLSK